MNEKNIIEKINISKNNLYKNLNNQIDTTGRINEKIQQNKFNYLVNEIIEEEPEPKEQSDKLIFLYQNNFYTLKRKIQNINNTSYSYEIFDINLNSILFVKNINEVYLLYNKETINDNIIQYWRVLEKFNPSNTLTLSNQDVSLITYGDIQLKEEQTQNQENQEKIYITNTTLSKNGTITTKNINSNELTIGQITTEYNENKFIPFKPLYYYETTKGIYIINETNEIKFISNNSINTEYLDININSIIDTNLFKIITMFIYNDYLYLLIIYKLTETDTTLKSKILTFNEINLIYNYDNVLTQAQITLFDEYNMFINSINMNNNEDVYLFYNLQIFLLTFRNKEPINLIEKNDFNSLEQISENVYNVYQINNITNYYIKNNIYMFCEDGYYIYDIINNSLLNDYDTQTNKYIIYPYKYEDTEEQHKYNYSLIDNENIYFKYKGLNNIYIFDKDNATSYDVNIKNIIIFKGKDDLFNYNVSHYTINNDMIYFLEERKKEDNNYEYTFYKYNINNKELTNKKELDFYDLNVRYNSIIPMIYTKDKILLYEINEINNEIIHNYCNSLINLLKIELNENNIKIKDIKINDENIIISNETKSDNLIVNDNIIIKDKNDFYVKNLSTKLSGGNFKLVYYHITSKALFYFGSEANSSTLRAYHFQSNVGSYFLKIIEEPQSQQEEKYQFHLTSFIYNDLIYVLIGDIRATPTVSHLYFSVYDIIKSNNTYKIVLIKNIIINNDTTYPFDINGNCSYPTFIKYNEVIENETTGDVNINDVLYVYNPMYNSSNEIDNRSIYKCILNKSDNLEFKFFKKIEIIQTKDVPLSVGNLNKNYANVKYTLFNDKYNIVYYLYLTNNDTQYNIYVLNLNTNNNYTITLKNGNNYITKINNCFLYENNIYLNIINDKDEDRGIYYVDNLLINLTQNIDKQIKLLDLFKNNAYLISMNKNDWYIITTQNKYIKNGIIYYTYYLNYYNKEKNYIKSLKLFEKQTNKFFSLKINPIILNNDIYIIDGDYNYSVFVSYIYSNLISSEKTILNNNLIITKNSCKIKTEPNDTNDIVNKNYVDYNKPGKKIYTNSGDTTKYGEIFNDYNNNSASGNYSSSFGFNNKSNNDYMFSVGKFNNNNDNNIIFCVGNGTNNTRENAFSVKNDNQAYSNSFNTSGADYAELYETYDNSITKEQFKGHFITLIGDKVKIASNTDDYILGVYSSNYSILGNNPMDWKNKYIKDENNEIVFETIKQLKNVFEIINYKKLNSIDLTVEEIFLDENTNDEDKYEFIKYPKINPDYNPSLSYINRNIRDEWIPVGLLGKLLVIDNGLCNVNEFCKVAADGTAEPYIKEIDGNINHYKVINRYNETRIFIIFK